MSLKLGLRPARTGRQTWRASNERRPGNAGVSVGCTARGGRAGRPTARPAGARRRGLWRGRRHGPWQTTVRPRWTAVQRALDPNAAGPQPARRPAGSRGKSPWRLGAPGADGLPGRPSRRPRPGRSNPARSPAAAARRTTKRRSPGGRALAPNFPRSADSGRPATTRRQRRRLPARAGRGPWGQGAGLRSGQTSSAAPLPAPRPGRPAESGAPPGAAARSGPRVGAGSPRGPADPRKLPAALPWPLATRPPPLPLHLLGRGLHPPGRPRPWLPGLARRGTGRQWLELLLAPRVRGSPGRRRRGRRLLHLPGALTPRFQRADPSGTFATLLAFHGRHVTPPPASLSAAYQPGRGACGPGSSAAGPLRPAAVSSLPVAARPRPPPPARGLPAECCGPFCHFVTRPQLQLLPHGLHWYKSW